VKEDVWREKFIADYGLSLKKESNYELAYKVVGGNCNNLFRYAIREAHNDLVKYLWSKDKNLYILLTYASLYGNYELVEFLLDEGVDIHTQDNAALEYAAEYGHLEIVKLLLDRGADIHTNNDYALRYASRNGHLEVVKLLLDRGANIHAQKDEALRLAKKYKYFALVKLLLGATAIQSVPKKRDMCEATTYRGNLV
jgi:ankyrin repeat protein